MSGTETTIVNSTIADNTAFTGSGAVEFASEPGAAALGFAALSALAALGRPHK